MLLMIVVFTKRGTSIRTTKRANSLIPRDDEMELDVDDTQLLESSVSRTYVTIRPGAK
jgi:hypothetical protein